MKRVLLLTLVAVLIAGISIPVFAAVDEPVEQQEEQLRLLSEEEMGELREKIEEVRTLRETIREQKSTLREKFEVIAEIRRQAGSERDWDTLRKIREYRRVNIQIKMDLLELRLARMDVFDMLDEAREARNPELAGQALDELILNLKEVVALNEQAIENAQACIEELQ